MPCQTPAIAKRCAFNMPIYSNSKLRTFESCPLQFKFRYVDDIRTDIESVEAFAGKRVHETLDWLYRQVRDCAVPTMEALAAEYQRLWETQWHRLVHIQRKKSLPEDYARRGRRCLETYYRGNWPFDADHTLGLEVEVVYALDDDVLLRGFVDRVSRGRQGELVIHDYKTSSYLPRRSEVMSDLQLAIYQLGAAERWPNARAVHLVWHFLAFGRRITVQLNRAIEGKRRVLAQRVQAAEAAIARGEFPPRESKLCDWCAYRPICPAQGGSADAVESLVLEPQLTAAQRAARAAVAAGQQTLL